MFMGLSKQTAIAAILGLLVLPTSNAATLSIPVQSGMIENQQETGCELIPDGASYGSECDVQIPIVLSPGLTVQEISLVYKGSGVSGYPLNAELWEIDYANSVETTPFSPWTLPASAPPVTGFKTGPLMGSIGKFHPHPFVVQPDTLYTVHVVAGPGFTVAGLQVIYQ
jgi:hypothetical protein